MNGATFIVVVILSLAVLAAVAHIIKNVRDGKSSGCGADCAHCAMDCAKRDAEGEENRTGK